MPLPPPGELGSGTCQVEVEGRLDPSPSVCFLLHPVAWGVGVLTQLRSWKNTRISGRMPKPGSPAEGFSILVTGQDVAGAPRGLPGARLPLFFHSAFWEKIVELRWKATGTLRGCGQAVLGYHENPSPDRSFLFMRAFVGFLCVQPRGPRRPPRAVVSLPQAVPSIPGIGKSGRDTTPPVVGGVRVP